MPVTEEARIVTRIDVPGLDEIVQKFGTFTGSITDTQRAMREIGRLGQEAVQAGGVLKPEDYECAK